jgi:hypothetical protein
MAKAREGETAMALRVRSGDWERIALVLLIGVVRAARDAPPDTIDRLLELLAGEEVARDAGA